ncbi:hypothetical protein RRF57_007016 [Xylaria bambusicola]|uniref:Uncharacterized protein n=1 Tax=Xylaria bambusicola TaxID=326684 RepID=A0AAN7UM45_9PEZI
MSHIAPLQPGDAHVAALVYRWPLGQLDHAFLLDPRSSMRVKNGDCPNRWATTTLTALNLPAM